MSVEACGKSVRFQVDDEGIHLIFKTEADAIEMMPKGPSVYERRGNVLVMIRNHPLAGQLKRNMYHKES